MARTTKAKPPKSAGHFTPQKISAAKTIRTWLADGRKSNVMQLRKWLSDKGLPLSITNLINDPKHMAHCSCALEELEVAISEKRKRS